MREPVRERLREVMGWVEEAIQGLGHGPRPMPVTATWDVAAYKQAVLFEAWDVEGRDRSETQDRVLDKVKRALVEGINGLRSRDADPAFGWRVYGAIDLSESQAVGPDGKRLFDPSMPRYACWIEWRGPKPPTWPHMMHLGQAENALSYPVGLKPEWR